MFAATHKTKTLPLFQFLAERGVGATNPAQNLWF